jgi:anti-anti-sigma factor
LPLEPLILEGEVDLANADEVLSDLLRQLETRELGDDDPVVIDASGLTYFGSRGMWMLAQFRSRSGREVIVTGTPARMRRVFEISGLDQMFDLR